MFDQGLHGGGNDPLAGSSVFESVANNETSEVLMNAADRLSGADRSTRAWGAPGDASEMSCSESLIMILTVLKKMIIRDEILSEKT